LAFNRRELAMKKIAVIGATGMLGLPVVAELVNAGFEVTALARDPRRARKCLPADVRIVQADVRDIGSLEAGLSGQDAVYLNLSIAPSAREDDFHTEKEGLDNIIAAARGAGVKRIAYLSAMIEQLDPDRWWGIDIWRKAIASIKASGISYTIFYATNFMETLPEKHVCGHTLSLVGTAQYPNYWIAARDYALQVAKAFRMAKAANREYFVQGPEPLTYDEAASRFAKSFGRRLFVVRVPLFALKWLGKFSRPADFSANILGAVLAYPEKFKAHRTWKELGRPATTVEAFARGLRI
jgi:uncharacterized protein YbjT (DUF2867 family)